MIFIGYKLIQDPDLWSQGAQRPAAAHPAVPDQVLAQGQAVGGGGCGGGEQVREVEVVLVAGIALRLRRAPSASAFRVFPY